MSILPSQSGSVKKTASGVSTWIGGGGGSDRNSAGIGPPPLCHGGTSSPKSAIRSSNHRKSCGPCRFLQCGWAVRPVFTGVLEVEPGLEICLVNPPDLVVFDSERECEPSEAHLASWMALRSIVSN